MSARETILIALHAREATGRGQLVSTDLLSAAFHSNAWRGANDLNRERITSHDGVGASEDAIRTSFETSDGYIEVSPVFSDDALRDVSVAMGLADLSQDPRFADKAARPHQADEINAILDQRFAEKTTDEWVALLEPQGVLCTAVRTYAEAAQDPQVLANEMVVAMPHGRVDGLQVLGTPIRLHGTPASHRTPAPDLGEHNLELMRELGFSEHEIAECQRQGAFG